MNCEIRAAIVFSAVFLTAACSSPSSATAPTPTPTPAPRPPALGPSSRVSGMVVDDRGVGLADVTMAFGTYNGTVNVGTDGTGRYDVTVDPWIGGVSVDLRKPGHEPATHFIQVGFGEDATRNLRFYPILRTAPGQSLRLSVGVGDPACGLDWEFVCRTVRLTSTTTGTVTVEAIPDREGIQLGLASATDFWPRINTSVLSLPITSGEERSVNVLLWWATTATEGFTLITSFDPTP